MNITFYGQSCFMITTADKKILFDPFISANPLAKHIDIQDIHPDFILVTHGHFDHVHDLAQIASQSNAQVISVHEVVQWAEKQGVTHTHEFNLGCVGDFDFGRLRVVPAVHSAHLPDGSFGGTPTGLVLEIEGKVLYFAGDTALTYEMKVLPYLYEQIYLAFLPIGGHFTMNAKEAAIAASQFIACKAVIGMHFDTFPPITIDANEAKAAFEKVNIPLHLLNIGETRGF